MPQNLITLLQAFVALLGAYFLIFWVALVLWTARDIHRRSRDILVQILAVLLVLFFHLAGLLLYWVLRPAETLAESYERSLEEEALLQGLEERQACPTCKQQVQPDFILCPNCQTQLKRRCVSCDRPLHLRWEVCPYCGQPVAPPAEEAAPAEVPVATPVPLEAAEPAAVPVTPSVPVEVSAAPAE
jgi:RNA polymerase subunit RPABC4/transcription elongation factor Spt4